MSVERVELVPVTQVPAEEIATMQRRNVADHLSLAKALGLTGMTYRNRDIVHATDTALRLQTRHTAGEMIACVITGKGLFRSSLGMATVMTGIELRTPHSGMRSLLPVAIRRHLPEAVAVPEEAVNVSIFMPAQDTAHSIDIGRQAVKLATERAAEFSDIATQAWTLVPLDTAVESWYAINGYRYIGKPMRYDQQETLYVPPALQLMVADI